MLLRWRTLDRRGKSKPTSQKRNVGHLCFVRFPNYFVKLKTVVLWNI